MFIEKAKKRHLMSKITVLFFFDIIKSNTDTTENERVLEFRDFVYFLLYYFTQGKIWLSG